VLSQYGALASVVKLSLLSPVAPATRLPPIHEWCRLSVLPFPILDDQWDTFVVGINRKLGTAARLSGTTA
jgi:hypothetical protein